MLLMLGGLEQSGSKCQEGTRGYLYALQHYSQNEYVIVTTPTQPARLVGAAERNS